MQDPHSRSGFPGRGVGRRLSRVWTARVRNWTRSPLRRSARVPWRPSRAQTRGARGGAGRRQVHLPRLAAASPRPSQSPTPPCPAGLRVQALSRGQGRGCWVGRRTSPVPTIHPTPAVGICKVTLGGPCGVHGKAGLTSLPSAPHPAGHPDRQGTSSLRCHRGFVRLDSSNAEAQGPLCHPTA